MLLQVIKDMIYLWKQSIHSINIIHILILNLLLFKMVHKIKHLIVLNKNILILLGFVLVVELGRLHQQILLINIYLVSFMYMGKMILFIRRKDLFSKPLLILKEMQEFRGFRLCLILIINQEHVIYWIMFIVDGHSIHLYIVSVIIKQLKVAMLD